MELRQHLGRIAPEVDTPILVEQRLDVSMEAFIPTPCGFLVLRVCDVEANVLFLLLDCLMHISMDRFEFVEGLCFAHKSEYEIDISFVGSDARIIAGIVRLFTVEEYQAYIGVS